MSEVVSNLVSVIIPVRNRSRWLPDAVQSALSQSHSPVEILLCDDGSTDGTEQLVADLAARCPEQIRVLHLPPRGPGPAREAGRQAARGEFIQYLDSDDLLLPDKFRLQIAALHQRPECGIAYGMTRLVDEQNNILVEPFKWTGREISQLFPGLLVDRWWCTHTPLYRRTLCDQIGPWTDLRYSQDWEYDARAGALNVQLAFINQPVSHHRHHGGVRQTQHGKWLEPSDQVRFFTALLRAAQASGVAVDAPEMKHFGRWIFAATRQVARRGDIAAAKTLLALAEECADHSSRELQIYRRLSRVVGWRATAIVGEWYKRTVSRDVGPDTLRQSWTTHAPRQP